MGYVLKVKKLAEHEWKKTTLYRSEIGQDGKVHTVIDRKVPTMYYKWFASPVEPTLEALLEKYGDWCTKHKDNWCIVPQ